MLACGEKQINAIIQIEQPAQTLLDRDPEVTLLATAEHAAQAVDWLGFLALLEDPSFRVKAGSLPMPREDDNAKTYLKRLWPLLSKDERGAVLDLGLHRMVGLKRVAGVGIRVRVWRAYLSGEWRFSPSACDSFREWVRVTLEDNFSTSEASYLYRLCEILAWLLAHPLKGIELPEDPEEVFCRPLYRRWRSMVPRLWSNIRRIEQAKQLPLPSEDTDEVLAKTAETIQQINNEDLNIPELEQLAVVKKPAPVIIRTTSPDPRSGMVSFYGEATPGQLALLKQRAGNTLKLCLQGEQYDVEQYCLVEYRCWQGEYWAMRVLDDEDNWSGWLTLSGRPEIDGTLDSLHEDQDMQLEYTRYWQKVEEE